VRRKAQGAIATERDHRVDTKPLQRFKDLAGLVTVGDRTRIEARGVEDRPTHSVDSAHAVAGERHAIGGNRSRIVGVTLKHALPTPLEAHHFPAKVVRR
jgi:hypothetical protein